MVVELGIYFLIVLGHVVNGVTSPTHNDDVSYQSVLTGANVGDDVRTLIGQLESTFLHELAALKKEIAEMRTQQTAQDEIAALQKEIAEMRNGQATQHEMADLKKEIEDMRTEHALEMTKQREEFLVQLSIIREECQNMRGQPMGGPNSTKVDEEDDSSTEEVQAELSGVSDFRRTADVDSPRGVNGSPYLGVPREREVTGKHAAHITRRESVGSHVAFYAKLSQGVNGLGGNQHVVFENVVTNVGNGYDKNIGVFRAPVSGTYLFSTTITTQNRAVGHFAIYINQNRESLSYVNGAENAWDESSQTIIVHLHVGDDVTVRSLDGTEGAEGNKHSLFSGTLLFEDEEHAPIVGK